MRDLQPSMQASSSVEAYIASPVGRYILGPTYLVWCKTARLAGMVIWGVLRSSDIASVIRTVDIDTDGRTYVSLVDARRVESVVPAAFDMLATYVESHRDKLPLRISSQAVLRPEGLVGAAVSGFPEIVCHRHPVKVFTDAHEALIWLGAGEQEGVIHEVEGLLDGVDEVPSVLSDLRRHIRANMCRSFPLNVAATALGLSTRSLQRHLREANSCFRAELDIARVDYAKRLLSDPRYQVKRIALDVGCASASAFAFLFRKIEGQSPRTWRAMVCSVGEKTTSSL
jgi:AraC-like DNA-binding protein